MNSVSPRRFWVALVVVLLMTAFVALLGVSAAAAAPSTSGPWWDVEPEPENPSPFYDSILYSEIAPKLREIE